MAGPPALYRLYRLLTPVLLPLAWRSVSRRLADHGVDPARARERLGHASQPRPTGRLVWFHAASVGESLSVLRLIEVMGESLPDTEFLITSGTATSAELVAKRMPPRARHQFAPLDAPGPVRRFLDHWQPAAALFVESELWPLMIVETSDQGAPLALVNARLSAKSVDGWRKWPRTSRFILNRFTLLLAQNRQTADDLIALGAPADRVALSVNLKATTTPPPVDPALLAQMRRAIAGRPIWLASSTHPGEEEIVLAAYRQLLADHPDLLLILAPRHPERGAEVAELISRAGLQTARRGTAEALTPDTQVYLADTLGETGTWYSLAPFAFLGATLADKGGHNPIEPAQFGVPLIVGPSRDNNRAAFEALALTGGLAEVSDASTLAAAVARWLDDPAALDRAQDGARRLVQDQDSALQEIAQRLCTALHLEAGDA